MKCEVCGKDEEDGIEIVEEDPIQRCRRCKNEYQRGRDSGEQQEEEIGNWKEEAVAK